MAKCDNCGDLFRTGEDFRDHLPCETELQRLRKRVAQLEEGIRQIEFNCAPGLTHDAARTAVNRARLLCRLALRDNNV